MLQLDPENLHAHSTLAQLAIRRCDWPQALAHALDGLNIDQSNEASRYPSPPPMPGALEGDDLQTAIDHLRRFIDRYSDNANAKAICCGSVQAPTVSRKKPVTTSITRNPSLASPLSRDLNRNRCCLARLCGFHPSLDHPEHWQNHAGRRSPASPPGPGVGSRPESLEAEVVAAYDASAQREFPLETRLWGYLRTLHTDTPAADGNEPLQALDAWIDGETGICLQRSDALFLLVLLAALPLTVLPVRFIGRKLRTKARAQQDQRSDITCLAQNLGGRTREIVGAFCLEAHELGRYRLACEVFMQCVLKAVKYTLFLSPAIEVIAAFGITISFLYAWKEQIPAEDVVAILLALYLSYEPLKKLGRLHNRLKEGSASLDRIEEILHAPEVIHDPENPTVLEKVRGEITFRDVAFSRRGQNQFCGISPSLYRRARPMRLLAPGAGKVLTQLIPRFYDVFRRCYLGRWG